MNKSGLICPGCDKEHEAYGSLGLFYGDRSGIRFICMFCKTCVRKREYAPLEVKQSFATKAALRVKANPTLYWDYRSPSLALSALARLMSDISQPLVWEQCDTTVMFDDEGQ